MKMNTCLQQGKSDFQLLFHGRTHWGRIRGRSMGKGAIKSLLSLFQVALRTVHFFHRIWAITVRPSHYVCLHEGLWIPGHDTPYNVHAVGIEILRIISEIFLESPEFSSRDKKSVNRHQPSLPPFLSRGEGDRWQRVEPARLHDWLRFGWGIKGFPERNKQITELGGRVDKPMFPIL